MSTLLHNRMDPQCIQRVVSGTASKEVCPVCSEEEWYDDVTVELEGDDEDREPVAAQKKVFWNVVGTSVFVAIFLTFTGPFAVALWKWAIGL